MKETKTLEFKERPTSSFLKTVSAFANYRGGDIVFGVDDEGKVVGLESPDDVALAIENKVNDCIDPIPSFDIIVNSNSTVTLTVRPGDETPYLYKSAAYKRSGTSTVAVDSLEQRRLVLRGRNLDYESLPSPDQDLCFMRLENDAKREIGIEDFNRDTLKTLNLLSDESGFNMAALLLADSGKHPGIDIARFGESTDMFLKRLTLSDISVLAAFDDAVDMYRDNYVYEQIEGTRRRIVERIPESAFREALANAIVHRSWDVGAHIRISMWDDRIEICSPGGLPEGIDERAYLNDMLSKLRNPILANAFFRLHLIEAFGTGIRKIRRAYENSVSKPVFNIAESTIEVILPVIAERIDLTDDQRSVLDVLSAVRPLAMGEIAELSPFGRTKTTKLIKELVENGLVLEKGNGRGLTYKRA